MALLAVAIVWGSSYLATKEVVNPDSVFAFLVIRFALAAAGLAVLLAPTLRHTTRSELVLGALFGLILSVIFTLETFGVTQTTASNAGLIVSLTIVMTPLLEQWVRRTRLPPAFYGGTVIAIVGVALMTQSGGLAAPSLGDLLMMLAAAARAVHVTVIARLSEHRKLNPARVTLVQLCTALAVFAIISQSTGHTVQHVATHMSSYSWILTIYLAMLCTVFAFCIQTWAVRRTSPARVSLLLGTEPLWAAAIAVLLAGEPLTLIGIAGAVLILAGTNWSRIIDSADTDNPRSKQPMTPPAPSGPISPPDLIGEFSRLRRIQADGEQVRLASQARPITSVKYVGPARRPRRPAPRQPQCAHFAHVDSPFPVATG
jgi:drug/metabolite transporter (DMT)-like permease